MSENTPDAPANVVDSEMAPSKRRKKIIATVAAVVLVLGGGVAAVVGVSQHNAETAHLCAVALSTGADALDARETSLSAADEALKAVESTDLPDGGTTTLYADRTAVEARSSGAQRIADVADARTVLVDATVAAECEDREQATAITDASEATTAASGALDEAVAALNDDFEAFQADEAARLAAEKKAAEEAAAAEAARVAAEQAASEEAERQRIAEQESYSDPGGGGNDGGGNNGGTGPIVPPHGGGGCPPGTTFIGEGCA